jgi:hypothetical protein
MSKVRLAAPVTAKRTKREVVKPALDADKCDGCGDVFVMKEFCNDGGLGTLEGTFEDTPDEFTGNGFSATVCSFKCAHKVFADGGWKKIPEYKKHAKAGCTLARGKLTVTRYVLNAKQAREDWKKRDHKAERENAEFYRGISNPLGGGDLVSGVLGILTGPNPKSKRGNGKGDDTARWIVTHVLGHDELSSEDEESVRAVATRLGHMRAAERERIEDRFVAKWRDQLSVSLLTEIREWLKEGAR